MKPGELGKGSINYVIRHYDALKILDFRTLLFCREEKLQGISLGWKRQNLTGTKGSKIANKRSSYLYMDMYVFYVCVYRHAYTTEKKDDRTLSLVLGEED